MYKRGTKLLENGILIIMEARNTELITSVYPVDLTPLQKYVRMKY